jgi:hypothetical protein
MLLGLERIDNDLFDEPWITTQDGMPLSEYSTPGLPQDVSGEEEGPELEDEVDD